MADLCNNIRITIENIFRGGFICGGTNLTVNVNNLTSSGKIDHTGIKLEDVYESNFNFNNINLIDGNLSLGPQILLLLLTIFFAVNYNLADLRFKLPFYK